MSDSFLKLNANAEFSLIKVGDEQQPFLKVDSFMHDANVLRQYAINNSAFKVADTFYPGVRMPIPNNYIRALLFNLKDALEKGFGFHVDKLKAASSSYSMVTFAPDELSFGQKIPHFDSLSHNGLAFIHYLCDFPKFGTSLYRHKATGYEYVDNARVDGYYAHLNDEFKDSSEEIEGYIDSTTDAFELIHSSAAVFNRIIAYYGKSLHSGNIADDFNFSADPNVGRLTITTFMEFE